MKNLAAGILLFLLLIPKKQKTINGMILYKVFIHKSTGTVTKVFSNPFEIPKYLLSETNAITNTRIEQMLKTFHNRNLKMKGISTEPYFLSSDYIVVEQIEG